MNNQYNTLSEAVNGLSERGYTLDFNLDNDKINCRSEKKSYAPDEFEIDEFHRFEGMTNPDDMSIVYAISTNDGSKGTLTYAYGAYSDPISAAMVKKMNVK